MSLSSLEQPVQFLSLFISLMHLHVDCSSSSRKTFSGKLQGQIPILFSPWIQTLPLGRFFIFFQFAKTKPRFISGDINCLQKIWIKVKCLFPLLCGWLSWKEEAENKYKKLHETQSSRQKAPARLNFHVGFRQKKIILDYNRWVWASRVLLDFRAPMANLFPAWDWNSICKTGSFWCHINHAGPGCWTRFYYL